MPSIVQMAAEELREALNDGTPGVAGLYAADLARHLLLFGRHSEADPAVRQALTLAKVPQSRAWARLAATLLAVRRGDLPQARLHVRRAQELMPDLEERPTLWAPPTLAEYLIAEGGPDQALEMLSRTMAVQVVDPRVADEMLVLAARAAADLADQARDHRDPEGVTRAQRSRDEIVELRQGLQPPPFARITTEDLVRPTLEALYNAESARCLGRPGTSALWQDAAHRCASAGLRWDEAIASYRWAHALMTEEARKTTIAVPLRSAYRLVSDLAAGPLRHEVEKLAKLARITLDEPHVSPVDDVPDAFSSLTSREREILGHLVAGRTYAEIATALFISEKTVSVHVSNLLRKTATSSRHEVAALASRLGYPAV